MSQHARLGGLPITLAGLGLALAAGVHASDQEAKESGTLRGHTNDVLSIAITADGKTLVSGSADKTIKLWDLATGKERVTLKWRTRGVISVSIAADGKTLASGSGDGTIELWDLSTGKELSILKGHNNHATVALTADGRTLASGSMDKAKSVKLWDVATGKTRMTLDLGRVRTVALTADGKTVACITVNRIVTLWDLRTGQERARLRDAGDWRSPLAFTADGRMLASFVPQDATVKLWEVATGKERVALEGHVRDVRALAFSADGRILAAGSEDGTVTLWDVTTGKERGTLRSEADVVHCLAFTPNGQTLAVAEGPNTTIRLWDVSGLRRPEGAPAAGLSDEELKAAWNELAGADASRAHRAVWALTAAPRQTLPWLKGRLRPITPPDPKRLAQLLADLDSDDFAVREEAARALKELDESAGPALRKALADRPSAETRQRLEQLRGELDQPPGPPERLRVLRAVEVLEHIGTAEARRILERLAGGMPEARVTEDAKQSLDRLAKRDALQGYPGEKLP
jgi:WD40 repeat protein